jgi:hypothetical protein
LPDGPSGWSDAAGVALDGRYHVYVADPCNDRVLQFDPFGRLVHSYGAPAPARHSSLRVPVRARSSKSCSAVTVAAVAVK